MLRLELDFSTLAHEVHSKFSSAVGSDQIATQNALRWIGLLASSRNRLSVLEIGGGIGTISYFITRLSTPIDRYVVVERDSWCRSNFKLHLGDSRIDLVNDVDSIGENLVSNLIIIDDLLDSSETKQVLRTLDAGIIVVEGHRFRQRLEICKRLISSKKFFKYVSVGKSTDSYKGLGVFHISKELTSHSEIISYLYLIRIRARIAFMSFRSARARISLRKVLLFPKKK